MTRFLLLHGGGTTGSTFDRLADELRTSGHDVIAPDMPIDEPNGDLDACADAAVQAVEDDADLVVVGHSFGALVAPLVCARRRDARALILIAPMIPRSGESASEWWDATDYGSYADPSLKDDVVATYIHDADPELAQRELAKTRDHGAASFEQPWPLAQWPDVRTHVVLFTDDRCFPIEFQRRVVHDRLGLEPVELAGSHMAYTVHPAAVARQLDSLSDASSEAAAFPSAD